MVLDSDRTQPLGAWEETRCDRPRRRPARPLAAGASVVELKAAGHLESTIFLTNMSLFTRLFVQRVRSIPQSYNNYCYYTTNSFASFGSVRRKSPSRSKQWKASFRLRLLYWTTTVSNGFFSSKCYLWKDFTPTKPGELFSWSNGRLG